MSIAPPSSEKRVRIPKAWKKVIERWMELPPSCSEADLEHNLVFPLFEALGFSGSRIKKGASINQTNKSGLKPDLLVHQDTTMPPALVVEVKRRDAGLSNCSDQDFTATCLQNSLYKDAVGYTDNGVRQYLNIELVKPELLASYGLVFNGDFFQLWRRVDGLVFPLTPIQRVTKRSLPELMQQLLYCLEKPQPALIAGIWNRKGGVAKTTNTINLGAALALQGKRVLLIDLDPQTDLTRGVGLTATSHFDYLTPCVDKVELREWEALQGILRQSIQSKPFRTSDNRSYTLSILPGDRDSLERFRNRTLDKNDPAQATLVQPSLVFRQVINQLKQDYDYIFIDVSPSPDKLAECFLYSCDAVLIPSDLGLKSLHHATSLYKETIPKMREIRARKERLHLAPWNLGIVFSNCPADVGALENVVKLELQKRNFEGKQYQTRLKIYAQTKVAEFKSTPVICWQNSPITKLYNELTNEVFLNHNFTDH